MNQNDSYVKKKYWSYRSCLDGKQMHENILGNIESESDFGSSVFTMQLEVSSKIKHILAAEPKKLFGFFYKGREEGEIYPSLCLTELWPSRGRHSPQLLTNAWHEAQINATIFFYI